MEASLVIGLSSGLALILLIAILMLGCKLAMEKKKDEYDITKEQLLYEDRPKGQGIVHYADDKYRAICPRKEKRNHRKKNRNHDEYALINEHLLYEDRLKGRGIVHTADDKYRTKWPRKEKLNHRKENRKHVSTNDPKQIRDAPQQQRFKGFVEQKMPNYRSKLGKWLSVHEHDLEVFKPKTTNCQVYKEHATGIQRADSMARQPYILPAQTREYITRGYKNVHIPFKFRDTRYHPATAAPIPVASVITSFENKSEYSSAVQSLKVPTDKNDRIQSIPTYSYKAVGASHNLTKPTKAAVGHLLYQNITRSTAHPQNSPKRLPSLVKIVSSSATCRPVNITQEQPFASDDLSPPRADTPFTTSTDSVSSTHTTSAISIPTTTRQPIARSCTEDTADNHVSELLHPVTVSHPHPVTVSHPHPVTVSHPKSAQSLPWQHSPPSIIKSPITYLNTSREKKVDFQLEPPRTQQQMHQTHTPFSPPSPVQCKQPKSILNITRKVLSPPPLRLLPSPIQHTRQSKSKPLSPFVHQPLQTAPPTEILSSLNHSQPVYPAPAPPSQKPSLCIQSPSPCISPPSTPICIPQRPLTTPLKSPFNQSSNIKISNLVQLMCPKPYTSNKPTTSSVKYNFHSKHKSTDSSLTGISATGASVLSQTVGCDDTQKFVSSEIDKMGRTLMPQQSTTYMEDIPSCSTSTTYSDKSQLFAEIRRLRISNSSTTLDESKFIESNVDSVCDESISPIRTSISVDVVMPQTNIEENDSEKYMYNVHSDLHKKIAMMRNIKTDPDINALLVDIRARRTSSSSLI